MTVDAKQIERRRVDLQRLQPPQMLGDRNLPVEHAPPGNVFQQLRPANQQISGITARIEGFDEELEQFWIHHEQLEKHAAQSVSFDEPDELVQRHVRIGGSRQPSKQERTQIAEHLARAGRDVQTASAFCQVRQRFRRRFLIPENVQALRCWFRPRARRRRDDSSKDRANLLHVLPQRSGEFFLGSTTETSREPIE